jgi:hypothetical protein
MQAIMETIFDIGYLVTVIILGVLIIKKAGAQGREILLFGIMTVLLGCGDAFHLVPRVYSLWTGDFEANAAALGAGKLVTSITMTVFYTLLFEVWRRHYGARRGAALSLAVYGLAVVRIGLCLFPQNEWLNYDAPLSWGIYRNIPFALLGLLMIMLFVREGGKKRDAYRWMWLAVSLSFAFYIPVVLWADTWPLIGMLMIPKTCAYVWIVVMGWKNTSG